MPESVFMTHIGSMNSEAISTSITDRTDALTVHRMLLNAYGMQQRAKLR